jgi:uncharacterized protein YukE
MADIDGTPIYVSDGLSGAGAWLNSQAGTCANELASLKSKLSPLAETWTHSKAASYYEGLQQEWNIAAEGLFGPDGVLGQIAHVMNVNWNNYSDAEWSNIGTWRH